jgi:hypothetical protein
MPSSRRPQVQRLSPSSPLGPPARLRPVSGFAKPTQPATKVERAQDYCGRASCERSTYAFASAPIDVTLLIAMPREFSGPSTQQIELEDKRGREWILAEGGIVKRPCDDLGRSSSEQALGSRRESAGSPIVTPRAQPFQ